VVENYHLPQLLYIIILIFYVDKKSFTIIFINKKKDMDIFGFNNMSDDDFRKEFLNFLNSYQSGLEGFMKKNYGYGREFNLPPLDKGSFDFEKLSKIFNEITNSINVERGEDENGGWEKRSWTSPDGSSSFSSFSRNSFYSPFDGNVTFRNDLNDYEEVDTIKLLEKKLNKAISREKYEDAAKIRDLIKSLKEDKIVKRK